MPKSRLALVLIGLWFAACAKSPGLPGSAGTVVGGSGEPTDLSYPAAHLVLTIGQVLAPQVPTVTGSVTSWTVLPALPAGLSLDAMTGAISGTTTARAPLRGHIVTATNDDGSASFALGVRVLGETRFAYGASSVEGSIAIFGSEESTGALFHQGWTSASVTGTTAVAADPLGRFLVAVDSFDLVSYLVDPDTGQLSLGDTDNLGSGPHVLALHPNGDFAVAVARGTNRVYSYSVEPVTGALMQVSQQFTGNQPELLAMDPLGRFAIVAHAYETTVGSERTLLVTYLIDPVTGVLTTSGTFNVALSDVTRMTFSPLGNHLYLTLSLPFPTVLHCAVNIVTGLPSLVATTDAGTTPVALAVEPRGERLYVVNQGSDDVTLFNIDPLNGNLTATSSFGASAGSSGLSFSDDGAQVYVVDAAARSITVHDLDPGTGLSTANETIRTRSGSSPLAQIAGSVGISRRATDLYVANEMSDDVVSYNISATTGQLDDNGLPPLPAGTQPAGLVVDPQGRFVYVSDVDSNQIVGFGVQPNGSLIDLMLPTDLASSDPTHMAIDLAGQYLYVTVDFFDLLVAYEIQPNGGLSAVSVAPMGNDPESITLDPTGTFVFVTLAGDGVTTFGQVSVYAINPTDGNLIALPSVNAPGHPAALAFNPAGTRCYVTFLDTDRVQPYDVGIGGTLTPIGPGSITQNEPREIELTRDGRFAFAAFEDSLALGGLLLYDVNPTTGALFNADNLAAQWRDSVASGTGPQLVEITPDGAFVYVLARGSEEVRVFSSDSVTGIATPVETQFPGLVPVGMGLRVVIE